MCDDDNFTQGNYYSRPLIASEGLLLSASLMVGQGPTHTVFVSDDPNRAFYIASEENLVWY